MNYLAAMEIYNFVEKLIKHECIDCNIIRRKNSNNRCIDCNFSFLNGIRTGKNFKKVGLYNLPKHRFFYLYHNLTLCWSFPELPNIDFNGITKISRKRWQWEVHHEDRNKMNDNIWNLLLVLNTEHQYLHRIEDINPMKDPLIISNLKSKYKDQIKNGTYHGIIKPTLHNSEKYKKLLEWLINLHKGRYQIDKKLSDLFNYSEAYNLRKSIETIIKRNNLKEYNIEYIENSTNNKKWFLVKDDNE